MKIVKFMLIFVLFGTAGTFLATLFAPKQHVVVHEMVINASLEQCWDVSFNPDKLVHWVDGLDTVETVLGQFDEKGYSARMVFRSEDQVTKTDYTIDSITRHKSAKTSLVLDEKILLSTQFNFEEVDSNSTNVKVITTLVPSGWMFQLMFSGAKDGLDEKRKSELQIMKKWLENQSTRPAE